MEKKPRKIISATTFYVFSCLISFLAGGYIKENKLKDNCLLAHQYSIDPSYGKIECHYILNGTTQMERENPELHGN